MGRDIGEPDNTLVEQDILAKIQPPDCPAVFPKIKANEPDLALSARTARIPDRSSTSR